MIHWSEQVSHPEPTQLIYFDEKIPIADTRALAHWPKHPSTRIPIGRKLYPLRCRCQFKMLRTKLTSHAPRLARALSASRALQTEYDYLVIGAGSGGMASARRAASYPGTRVAVVEQARLGGTCVNVGCVPKKLMFIAADMSHKLHHDFLHYGFEDEETGGHLGQRTHFDWPKLKARRDAYVLRLNGIYERWGAAPRGH